MIYTESQKSLMSLCSDIFITSIPLQVIAVCCEEFENVSDGDGVYAYVYGYFGIPHVSEDSDNFLTFGFIEQVIYGQKYVSLESEVVSCMFEFESLDDRIKQMKLNRMIWNWIYYIVNEFQ